MQDEKYIKINAIYKKLNDAYKNGRIIYIYGATGYGKTTAVRYFYRNKPYKYISGYNGYLEEMTETSEIKEDIVIFDDLSFLSDKKSQNYIIEMISSGMKKIILMGRSKMPSWLSKIHIEMGFLVADEKDLYMDKITINKLFDSRNINISDRDIDIIEENANGNAAAILAVTNRMNQSGELTKEIIEEARLDVFHYFDKTFFERWDNDVKQVLMMMCPFETFDIEMAEMVTGNGQIPRIMEEAIEIGSFLVYHGKGVYSYRTELTSYLKWKASILYSKNEICEIYKRGGLYYEIRDDIENSLKYYKLAGDENKVSWLLVKNAEKHPGMAHFYETRNYYFQLPEEDILKSVTLISGICMLHSLLLQVEESERWYNELKEYMLRQPKGSAKRKEAKIKMAYLDIALPHRGIHGIIDILKNVAVLCLDKNAKMPEFSVTSNLPSLMNGGLDFSEWSRNDKELALIMKKPVEIVLGKTGAGLVNIALAESGFEKGTMDVYEIMTRINTGYLMAETNGKIEMCFAATGIMVKVHMSKGQLQIAENLLKSFKEKLVTEGGKLIIPNLIAIQTWIDLHKGNTTKAKEWLKEAPDENKEFYILDRYRYIIKVRCLISQGNLYEALSLVERLGLYFTKYERHYLNIQNNILKAIILFRLDSNEWKEALITALKGAEKYHFIWVIAQEGIAIKPILSKLGKTEISEKFFKEIKVEVDKMAVYYPEYMKEEKILKEPLTETEKTLLNLMLTSLSSNEICELCNITYSTLKFHNRNIYRKLGVNSRKEAEIVANRLGLKTL